MYHDHQNVVGNKMDEFTDMKFLNVRETLKTDRKIAIVGKTGTGGLALMKDLLSQLKDHFDGGLAFCSGLDEQEIFKQFMDPRCIKDRFYPELLSQVLQNQIELKDQGINKKVFLVFNCCLNGRSFQHHAMKELMHNGRHYNVFTVFMMQSLGDTDSMIRTDIDYVFAMNEVFAGNVERMRREYFSMFSKEQFVDVFNNATKDSGCLFLDRTKGDAPLDECLKWYKAQTNLEPFELGTYHPIIDGAALLEQLTGVSQTPEDLETPVDNDSDTCSVFSHSPSVIYDEVQSVVCELIADETSAEHKQNGLVASIIDKNFVLGLLSGMLVNLYFAFAVLFFSKH
jgi:hypothetical protein